MSIDAFGIHLGPLYIRFYGLLIVGGLMLCSAIAAWMAKRDGRDTDHIWGGLTWMLIPGIIGARLWFVFFPSQEMVNRGFTAVWLLTHPFDMTNGPLAIWNGGLGIFGAVIGGLIGGALYGARHRLKYLEWIDIAAIVLPLGQAIGRWGNFINQELYGGPTTLPWGITIPQASRIAQYRDLAAYPLDQRFHPIFLYESLWCALTFVILLLLWLNYRRRFKPGDFLFMYFVSYAVIRFLMEFLRVDVTLVGALNVSQIVSALAGVGALLFLLWRYRFRPARESFYQTNPGQDSEESAAPAEKPVTP